MNWTSVPTSVFNLPPSVSRVFAVGRKLFSKYPQLWLIGGGARESFMQWYTNVYSDANFYRDTIPLKDIDLQYIGSYQDMLSAKSDIESQLEPLGLNIEMRSSESISEYLSSRDIDINQVMIRPEEMIFSEWATKAAMDNEIIQVETMPEPNEYMYSPAAVLRAILTSLEDKMEFKSNLYDYEIGTSDPRELFIFLSRAYEKGVENQFFEYIKINHYMQGINSADEAVLYLDNLLGGDSFKKKPFQEKLVTDIKREMIEKQWETPDIPPKRFIRKLRPEVEASILNSKLLKLASFLESNKFVAELKLIQGLISLASGDNLSVPPTGPFYHGTSKEFNVGDFLLPPEETGSLSEKGRKKNLDKVFFTQDFESAKIYARKAKKALGGDSIFIYTIEPQGTIEVLNPTPGTTVYMSSAAEIVDKQKIEDESRKR